MSTQEYYEKIANPSGRIQKKFSEMIWAEEIRGLTKDRSIRIMFQDEARFSRISDPRRCWAPYPARPVVHAAIVQEFTYTYAAVSHVDGVLDSLILPAVNTDMMNLFLEEVAIRHSEDFIVMLMDKAGWHTAKDLHIPENMYILHLPPYSDV